ncbi:lactonase family protein [Catenovulum sediminis]|uniref:Lactonase family protein n=1 Tax=Catenovulum sediminis TaxID=1740262 RepID=A0ABV1RGQ7_9ALTE
MQSTVRTHKSILTRLLTAAGIVLSLPNVYAQSAQFIIGADAKPDKSGVYHLQIDSFEKQQYSLKRVIDTQDPSYITLSEDGRTLFAVNEEANSGAFVFNYQNQQNGWQAVTSLTGLGDYPCHISYNEQSGLVSIANYVSPHTLLLDYNADNRKLTEVTRFKHSGNSGKSVHQRQEAPHPHWMGWSPDGKFLYAVDLGIDEVKQYQQKDGEWLVSTAAKLQAGDGPRHLAFHPTRNFAYLLNELSNTLVVYQQDLKSGALKQIQRVGTLQSDKPTNSAAIRLSSDGRFVYVSNRGENSIAVFKTQPNGKVEMIQSISTAGDWPRDFNFNLEENYLLVANLRSGNIEVFERNTKTGLLVHTDFSIPLATAKFIQPWVIK